MTADIINNNEKLEHHWLIAVEVYVQDNINKYTTTRKYNHLILTEHKGFTLNNIAQINQASQLRYGKEFPTEGVTIKDIIILNMMYLGYMTKSEFKGESDSLSS